MSVPGVACIGHDDCPDLSTIIGEVWREKRKGLRSFSETSYLIRVSKVSISNGFGSQDEISAILDTLTHDPD
jgi:hypothetical protein